MDIFKGKLLFSMSLFYSISYWLMVTGCISKMECIFFPGLLVFICCIFLRLASEEFSNLYLSKPGNYLPSEKNLVPSENENSYRRKVRFSSYIEIIEEEYPVKGISVDSEEESDRMSQECEVENNNRSVSNANREILQQDMFNGMVLHEYDCITETRQAIIEIDEHNFLDNSSQMLFDGNVFLSVLKKLCCSRNNCCNNHNKGERFSMKAHRGNTSNFHEIYYQETVL